MPREVTVPVSTRVPPETKRLLEVAADVEEVSVSSFLADAAEDAAIGAILRRGVERKHERDGES